ncbi:hypothetical protein NDU88_005064 [Pleurodeles waltl]|uniref:Uncharacterized protein n=1 Tax=Pleurodeles waltl TaxID=8319 RepID=A0AAV7MFT5_PLEWA|nr:hypothetical protein NDU88_005064 [Pleurodeles waltl]
MCSPPRGEKNPRVLRCREPVKEGRAREKRKLKALCCAEMRTKVQRAATQTAHISSKQLHTGTDGIPLDREAVARAIRRALEDGRDKARVSFMALLGTHPTWDGVWRARYSRPLGEQPIIAEGKVERCGHQ